MIVGISLNGFQPDVELVTVVGEGLVGGHEGEILLVDRKMVLRMLSISTSLSLAYALRASRWDKMTGFGGMEEVGAAAMRAV